MGLNPLYPCIPSHWRWAIPWQSLWPQAETVPRALSHWQPVFQKLVMSVLTPERGSGRRATQLLQCAGCPGWAHDLEKTLVLFLGGLVWQPFHSVVYSTVYFPLITMVMPHFTVTGRFHKVICVIQTFMWRLVSVIRNILFLGFQFPYQRNRYHVCFTYSSFLHSCNHSPGGWEEQVEII